MRKGRQRLEEDSREGLAWEGEQEIGRRGEEKSGWSGWEVT